MLDEDLQKLKNAFAKSKGFDNFPELIYKTTDVSVFHELVDYFDQFVTEMINRAWIAGKYDQAIDTSF